MNAIFTVLGTADDHTECELCGRTGLKSTVALQDADGNVVHYGSDCAARAAGWTERAVLVAVRAAASRARAAADRDRRAAQSAPTEDWLSWLRGKTGLEGRSAMEALGGFGLAREHYRMERGS